MSFVHPSFLSQARTADRHAVDAQPYGVIKVDDNGVVQLYNRYESELAGIPPSAAEGRNFFTQVAPCTNNRLVFGRFKDGVAKDQLDTEFNYTFTYKMKPTNVSIRIWRDPASRSNFIFVNKR